MPTDAQDVGKIATAIGLLASAVKSGEGWTPHCQEAVMEALDALDRLCKKLKH